MTIITDRDKINAWLVLASKSKPLAYVACLNTKTRYGPVQIRYCPDMSLHSRITLNPVLRTFQIEKEMVLDLDDLAPEFFAFGDYDAHPPTFHTFRPPHVTGIGLHNETTLDTIFVSQIDVTDDEYREELRAIAP